jgi:hypothetical protein
MDGTSDCTQSRVQNSNFATDLAHWVLPSTATAEWVATGAGSAATGAIYADNIQHQAGSTVTVVGGPEQCVPATPGNYKVYAQTHIASADGAGSVRLNIIFFKGAGCTAPITGSFQTVAVTARDVWTLIQGLAIAPAETTSMRVRLGLLKSLGQPSFKATFDNVLVAPAP